MENQLTKPRTDFSTEELKSLESFVNESKPGIGSIKESDVFQCFGLYMGGKTYTEIAQITHIKRDILLYLSSSSRWYEKKIQYYEDISSNILQKCKESKLETFNTVTTMVSALNKYFGNKFDRFLRTRDEGIIENLDTRLLAQYYKATETIDKLITPADDKEKKPLININMKNSAKITQTSENTIEIKADSSKEDEEVSQILASLAKLKRIRSSEED